MFEADILKILEEHHHHHFVHAIAQLTLGSYDMHCNTESGHT